MRRLTAVLVTAWLTLAPAVNADPGDVVTAARSRIGYPYAWGATGPAAFDCSGLVVWSYSQAGISVPRTSQQQANAGQPVDRADLQPGDIVIYYPTASHVGIYVGDGDVIHASTYGRPVAEVPIDAAGPYRNARRYLRKANPMPAKTPPKPDFNEYAMWSPNNNGRGGKKPIVFLLHTQEGDGNADSLARYLGNPANQVSYHYTISQAADGGVTVCDVVDTDQASWSVGNANPISINLCFAGSRAAWTRDQWLTQAKAIDVAAYLAVQDCHKYGMSTLVVSPPYSAGKPGISDHKWVTDVFGWGTHTDVGSGFPWDVFALAVAKYVGDLKPIDPPTTPEVPVNPSPDNPYAIPMPAMQAGQIEQLWQQSLVRWNMLGGRTPVEALAAIGAKLGVPGCVDVKAP